MLDGWGLNSFAVGMIAGELYLFGLLSFTEWRERRKARREARRRLHERWKL